MFPIKVPPLHFISKMTKHSAFLAPSVCHYMNLAFTLLVNNHFKPGIMEKYYATLVGNLLSFLFSPMSSPSIFLTFHLYRDDPQTQHSSNMASSLQNNMHSFQHACIFSTSNPSGQTIFLAWYML
jgi:hypothetical protein